MGQEPERNGSRREEPAGDIVLPSEAETSVWQSFGEGVDQNEETRDTIQ